MLQNIILKKKKRNVHIEWSVLQIKYVGNSMKPANTANKLPSEKGCASELLHAGSWV